MKINIDDKSDQAQCPHCKKWCEITFNEALKIREFKCCKVYGLHKFRETIK
jgi:hypothetical protein